MVLEGSEIRSLLFWISEGGLRIDTCCGELSALCLLGGSWFFGGGVTDLAREHLAVLSEEIHVGVTTDFTAHGLNKSHSVPSRSFHSASVYSGATNRWRAYIY